MASLVRDSGERNGKRRSPYWYACFTDPLGRRLKKSTGQTSKSKALQMARTWEKAAQEARALRLTEVLAGEVISELMQSLGGESLQVFSVEEWFKEKGGRYPVPAPPEQLAQPRPLRCRASGARVQRIHQRAKAKVPVA